MNYTRHKFMAEPLTTWQKTILLSIAFRATWTQYHPDNDYGLLNKTLSSYQFENDQVPMEIYIHPTEIDVFQGHRPLFVGIRNDVGLEDFSLVYSEDNDIHILQMWESK